MKQGDVKRCFFLHLPGWSKLNICMRMYMSTIKVQSKFAAYTYTLYVHVSCVVKRAMLMTYSRKDPSGLGFVTDLAHVLGTFYKCPWHIYRTLSRPSSAHLGTCEYVLKLGCILIVFKVFSVKHLMFCSFADEYAYERSWVPLYILMDEMAITMPIKQLNCYYTQFNFKNWCDIRDHQIHTMYHFVCDNFKRMYILLPFY